MSDKTDIEIAATEAMKNLRNFVNDNSFSDLALAMLDEVSAAERGAEPHEAHIALGKIAGVRYVFQRLKQLATPPPRATPKAGNGKDPDLDDGHDD